MPILVIYGDNISEKPSEIFNVDVWRIARKRAMDFVEAINSRGGDATFVSLPDMGIYGNTHAAFADLNNHKIYSQLEKWLAKKRACCKRRITFAPQIAENPVRIYSGSKIERRIYYAEV